MFEVETGGGAGGGRWRGTEGKDSITVFLSEGPVTWRKDRLALRGPQDKN